MHWRSTEFNGSAVDKHLKRRLPVSVIELALVFVVVLGSSSTRAQSTDAVVSPAPVEALGRPLIDATITASGNPGESDTERINDLLDSFAGKPATVRFAAGSYYIGPEGGGVPDPEADGEYSVKIPSNMTLIFDPGVVFVRRINVGGTINGTLRNKNLADGDENIHLSGACTFTIDNRENEGHQLVFRKVTNLAIDGCRWCAVSLGWNLLLFDNVHFRITGLDIRSGTELTEDGIHVGGGEDGLIADCHVESGDDALAIVAEMYPTDFDPGDAKNIEVTDCYLRSRKAHAFKCDVEPDATATISTILASNIVAKTGDGTADCGGGVILDDLSEGYRISDVKIVNFHLDASEANVEPLLTRYVKDVEIELTIESALLNATISGRNVTLANFQFLTPRFDETERAGLTLGVYHDSRNLKVVGGKITGASAQGVFVGSTSTSVDGFLISGLEIQDTARQGILVFNGMNGEIVENRISGTLADTAICEFAGATPGPDRNVFRGNVCRNNAVGGVIPLVGEHSKALSNSVR